MNPKDSGIVLDDEFVNQLSVTHKELVITKSFKESFGTEEFIVPEPELIEKIVKQVESYFSDENLIKDEFVLKHIRRNRDGFIVNCFLKIYFIFFITFEYLKNPLLLKKL